MFMDRQAMAANNDGWYAQALGFLRGVVQHLFQCSDVGLVSHKLS